MSSDVQTREYRSITEADLSSFLDLIASGHSFASAASLTRPHATGQKPGVSSWRAFFDRDPEAAERLEEARETFKQRVVSELIRRGLEGVEKPLVYRGVPTGHTVKEADNQILLRIASSLLPEYASQSVHKHNHEGAIEHRHAPGHVLVDLSNVYRLSAEQRRQLQEMIPILSAETEPRRIERQSAIVDADFEEADPYEIPQGGF
jgi:hypothetical protein